MNKFLISFLLTASITLGQTTPKSTTTGTSATKPKAGSMTTANKTKSVPKTTSPGSSTAPPKPLPDYPLSTKLQSNDNANPNYQKEKARGRGIKRDYTPRRTASGARPDTMNQRRP